MHLTFRHTQYACAVLLIVSSIALAFLQAITLHDIANGVLMYIAQAFLLAGSIFGLEYYVSKLTKYISRDHAKAAETTTTRNPEQQPAEHPNR